MGEELVEAALRIMGEIPEERVVTYDMIARVAGIGLRVIKRTMYDWDDEVPWRRVVSVHGTFPTTVWGEGLSEWEREGTPHDPTRGKVLIKECVVEQDWLSAVARPIIENVQNNAELSD